MNPIYVCPHIYMLQYIKCICIHPPMYRMWPEAMTKLTKALRIHGWHQQTSRSCQPLAAKLRIAYQRAGSDQPPSNASIRSDRQQWYHSISICKRQPHLSHLQSWLPRTNLVLVDTNNQFPVDDSGLTGCVVVVHISEILPRQSKCWVQSIETCFQQPHTQQLLKRGALEKIGGSHENFWTCNEHVMFWSRWWLNRRIKQSTIRIANVAMIPK